MFRHVPECSMFLVLSTPSSLLGAALGGGVGGACLSRKPTSFPGSSEDTGTRLAGSGIMGRGKIVWHRRKLIEAI